MLTAHLYDSDLSSPTFIKSYTRHVSNIRILWELHGGLQSIELDIGFEENDAYEFYRDYLGYRLIVADDMLDKPVADGFITGISIKPYGVHVVANGFWFRHFDNYYNFDTLAKDTNQGNISYTLEGADSSFTDDGQVWSDWAGSGTAKYEIEVAHHDGSTSTAFLGPTVSTTEIKVYEDYGLTNSGWLTRSNISIVDDEQGAIQYSMSTSGGSENHVTFIDGSQDWSDWETAAGNANYKIEVTNNNNTESWAYLGATVSTTEIFVYEDLAMTDDGFQDDIRREEDIVAVSTASDYFEIDGNFTEQLRVGDTFYVKESTGNDNTYTVGAISFEDPNTRITVDTANGESVPDSTADGDLEWFETTAVSYNVLSVETSGVPTSYEVKICYDEKTTSDVIKEAINTEVTALEYDSSGIEETSTVIGFWEPPISEGGMYPGELIEKLASMSDSSYRQWNYYVEQQRFSGSSPSKPKPVFEPQVDDGTYDWQIDRWMISGGGTVERNIQEMRNAVRIIYRDMDNDNAVALYPTATSAGVAQWNSDSDSISDYWRREIYLSGGDLTPDISAQYSNLYLNKFKDSMAKKSLEISSGYIYDDNHARWPLWAPIKYSESWFKLTDLFPDSDVLDSSWDRKQAFQAITMEYSSQGGGSLRLHFDTEDDSMAALLARVQAFR